MTVEKVWSMFIFALALLSMAIGFGLGKIPMLDGWGTVAGTLVFLLGFGHAIRSGWTQVPEKEEWIIEFFGKYLCTWKAGLRIMFPYFRFMTVKMEVVMSQQMMRLDMNDNHPLTYGKGHIDFIDGSAPVEAFAYFTIVDSYKAVYDIANGLKAIEEKLDSAVRVYLGALTLDQANVDKSKFDISSVLDIKKTEREWGIKIDNIVITDIELDEKQKETRSNLQKAKKEVEIAEEKIKQAEHEKSAAIIRANADRETAIIRAEGEKKALSSSGDGIASQVNSLKGAGVNPDKAIQHLSERIKWTTVGSRAVIIDSTGGGIPALGAQFAAGSRLFNTTVDEEKKG